MLAATQPMFLAWGPERIVLYNDSYGVLCGAKHPAGQGMRFADLWSDIIDDVGPIMDRTYAGESIHMDDICFLMQDRNGYAEETHFSFSYLPVRDADGTVQGMFCTCAETSGKVINERRLAFQLRLGDALRGLSDPQAIKRLAAQMLVDELQVGQVGFCEVDGHLRILGNVAVGDGSMPDYSGRRDMFSYGRDTLMHELATGHELVVADTATDPRTRTTWLTGVLRESALRAFAIMPSTKAGGLQGFLYLVHPEPRRWTPQDIETAQDVASRAWTAIERAVIEMALRTTRERLDATLKAAEIAAWDYDIRRDVIQADAHLARFFGLAHESLLKDAPLEAFIAGCHPDDQEAVRKSFALAFADSDEWRSEHRIAQSAGGWRWVISRGQIERDAEGRPLFMHGVLVDISDRKHAEEALQEADRRKDEFLATLAHELRNPLAPIRSAARISSDPQATPEQLRWSHDVIERQVRHMSMLLDDLLDVSRITRSTLDIRREKVLLSSVVEDALETARPVIDARGHWLDLDLGPAPLQLTADPLRIAQAISNLLTNAAKYTDPGGRLALHAALDGDTLVLRVRDNGIGIAAASLSRIFDMFSQVESAIDRSEGGLGIGLSLVRGLIGLHGGTVEAHSQGLGHGSEFVVRLPGASLANADPAPAAGVPAAMGRPAPRTGAAPVPGLRNHRPDGAASSLPPQAIPPQESTVQNSQTPQSDDGPDAAPQGRRIVVADDNQDGAETLAALLELDGHEVRLAHDGPSAVDAVVDFAPDVAFLDIGMPGLNGYEVAQRLRAARVTVRGSTRPTLLVALTGWGGESDKQRAAQAGFDRHLTKPVDPDSIAELLAGIG
jgi:PAS domain S-box-containing protein